MRLQINLKKQVFNSEDPVEIGLRAASAKKIASMGLISTKIITPEDEKIMQAIFIEHIGPASEAKLLDYSFTAEDKPGKYVIIAKLNIIGRDNKLYAAAQAEESFILLERKKTFVPPAPAAKTAAAKKDVYPGDIKTALYMEAVAGRFSFDEVVDLGGSAKNLTDKKGDIKINLKVTAPDDSVKDFSAPLRLLEKETKRFEFKYVPDRSKEPGEYKAVFKAVGDGKELAKEELILSIFDRSPDAAIKKMPLKTLIGEAAEIEVEATDDKAVNEVVIFYRLPAQKKFVSKKMEFSTGSRLKGVWKHKTEKFDDLGSYRFYITAEDSIGQVYKTNTHKVKIVEE